MILKLNGRLEDTRIITTPAICKFVTLLPDQRPGGKNYKSWHWYLIDELDLSIMAMFRSQGYAGPVEHYLIDYASYALYLENEQGSKKLSWLVFQNPLLVAELHADEDPKTCNFRSVNPLYVPSGWGEKALGLAALGIIKLERTETGGWKSIHWDGTESELIPRNKFFMNFIPSDKNEWIMERMIEMKMLDSEQVIEAMKDAATTKGGDILAAMLSKKFITHERIARLRAEHFGGEFISIKGITLGPEIIGLIKATVARKYKVIPIGSNSGTLTVASTDPSDLDTIESLHHLLKKDIELKVIAEDELALLLDWYYPDQEAIQQGNAT